MNKLLVSLVVLLIISMGSLFIVLSNQNSTITGNAVSNGQETKTFILTGENFKFTMDGIDNPDLVVKQGDKVRIEFSSVKGLHDWKLDEFDASTLQVRETDGTTFVEFTADKKGTFEYYCSVGKHRANGMFGKFIVE